MSRSIGPAASGVGATTVGGISVQQMVTYALLGGAVGATRPERVIHTQHFERCRGGRKERYGSPAKDLNFGQRPAFSLLQIEGRVLACGGYPLPQAHKRVLAQRSAPLQI